MILKPQPCSRRDCGRKVVRFVAVSDYVNDGDRRTRIITEPARSQSLLWKSYDPADVFVSITFQMQMLYLYIYICVCVYIEMGKKCIYIYIYIHINVCVYVYIYKYLFNGKHFFRNQGRMSFRFCPGISFLTGSFEGCENPTMLPIHGVSYEDTHRQVTAHQ